MGTEQGRLSVIIPTWSGTHDLAMMAIALCEQVRPMCDELIVTEDSHNYYSDFSRLADVYLLHDRLKHGINLALGLRVVSGDYVAMIDSDITITKGSLRDLCVPGRLVSPGIPKGWFIVGPRKVFEDFPPFENTYEAAAGFLGGIDEWWRAIQNRELVLALDTVEYHHAANQTASKLRLWKESKDLEYQKLHPGKEKDLQRHKARLTEDPLYATLWSDEKKGQA